MTSELILPDNLITINFDVKKPDIARKAKSYLKVLGVYIRHNQAFIAQAESDYKRQNELQLRELIHGIKGASGNLGMMPLFELSTLLETKLRNNELLNDIEFAQFCVLVSSSLQDAENIIQANLDDSSHESMRPFDSVCVDLVNKLEANETVSSELLGAFKQTAKKELDENIINEIVDALESFDYDEALQFLKTSPK